MGKRFKLSIITATYNSSDTILDLINEFKKYKKEQVEWIIIDNLSTDNTIDIITDNIDVVDKFLSEKDFGIYDAWNKGVMLAEGEYISFIGSDDLISKSYFDVALNAISFNEGHNVIAFKILYRSHCESIFLNSKSYSYPNNYPFNLGFYHPGTLFSNSLFIGNYFDISFKIAGDREFLTRNYKSLYPIIIETESYQIIHNFGGISTTSKFKLLQHQEVFRIFKINRINGIYIYWFMLKAYLKIFYFRLNSSK